jgi:hypothetical protein
MKWWKSSTRRMRWHRQNVMRTFLVIIGMIYLILNGDTTDCSLITNWCISSELPSYLYPSAILLKNFYAHDFT